MREDVIRIVDAYLNGLRAKDISDAPFHPNIKFEGPVGPVINGAATLRAVLTGFFPTIKGVNIIRHIVDGEWCATVFNFETTFGIVPMIDCFHVVDEQIVSIRLYYDPRPMLDAMNRP
jgi:limonene-1,2-epoxide hydrolase